MNILIASASNKNKFTSVRVILFLVFLFPLINCVNELKDEKLFRFIDNFSAKNIIETPFEKIENRFGQYKQQFGNNWVDFSPIMGNGKYTIKAFSTKYPVLEYDDSVPPKYLKFYKNGDEIKYMDRLSEGEESWRWMKGEEKIIVKKWFYRKEQITGNTFFSRDIILPSSELMIQLLVSNRYPNHYSPELVIAVGNKIIGSIIIGKEKEYRIYNKVKAGKYKLRLFIKKPQNMSQIKQKNIEIYIGQVRIKALSELILLYSPKKNHAISSPETYSAEFIKEPIFSFKEKRERSFRINDTSLRDLYALIKFNYLKKHDIYDLGIDKNPYNIKKKLAFGEDSINTLFSPTNSTYRFKIKVPKKAMFQFGYGTFTANQGKKEATIIFEILIKSKEKKERLFYSSYNTERKSQQNHLFHKKIDLSAYAKKNITLDLKTYSLPKNKKENINYSFWYNPVIYQASSDKDRRKNILLISLDTLRADHLISHKYGRKTTPNLFNLLKDSTAFFNCYSTAPSTLRAQMSLLTGLDPIGHQVYTQQDKLQVSIPTLAELLREKGYATCAFTGGGRMSSIFGFSKGFDRYYENKTSWLHKDTPERLLGKAVKWLNKNKDKNFFLFLHTYQPHDPYRNSNPYGQIFLDKNSNWNKIELFKYLSRIESSLPFQLIPLPEEQKKNIIALYDGEIRYTDECLIKPMISRLKELGLYNNTMIIITSDHGEAFYDHGMWMHGGHLYNELIKIPLIIKFPKSKYKSKKVHNNVRITDVLPTVLKELNINYSQYDFDGKDLFPTIKSKPEQERLCFAEIPVKGNLGKISVVYKNYKFILNRIKYKDKYKNQIPAEEFELYNLEKDPLETENIINKNPKIVRLLHGYIEQYFKKEKTVSLNKKEKPEIDKRLEEKLKALGYIK